MSAAAARPAWRALLRLRRGYSVLLVLAAWETASRAGAVNTFLLPPASEVLVNLWNLATEGRLLFHLAESLLRVAAGLGLAVAAGIPLGLWKARSRLADAVLDPVMAFWFPVPKVGLIPLALLFFGFAHGSKIALVFADALLPLVVATYHGALHTDRRLIWSARAMGDSERRILWRVVLPAALPQIFTGLRLAVTVSLLVVFLAEMVASSSGLGHVMIYALRTLETKDVFSALVTISLIAFLADWLVIQARRRVLVWHA
ncbi:MAG: ABC transporter permease [Candidatus Odyssella sp.]|nr:ABC transporter permease [Candidatus Odyssella sp.]